MRLLPVTSPEFSQIKRRYEIMKTYFVVNRADRSKIGFFQSNLLLTDGAILSVRGEGLYTVIAYADRPIKFGDFLCPDYIQTKDMLDSFEQEWTLFSPVEVKSAEDIIAVYKAAINARLVSCVCIG